MLTYNSRDERKQVLALVNTKIDLLDTRLSDCAKVFVATHKQNVQVWIKLLAMRINRS